MVLEAKKVTRNDVARRAGVAPSTVSYVINNGPRPVSDETREKVLEAIDALEYRPNAVARHLRRQCTTTIGLIVPDTCNTYFAEVAQGIEAVAFENNYMVMFCHSDYQLERELAYVDTLYAEQVAGVLIIPATQSMESLKRLQKYHIPTVSLDRTPPGIETSAVVANNYRGGYLSTQYLLELGHRRIGCIARPVELSHAEERVRGHLTALRDAGVAEDPELIARGGYKMENGRQAMSQLLDLAEPPTAVFCYNDMMAIGALRCAVERDLDVPGDISIVGFDDIAETSFTCPALTTIHQDKFEMGRQGMNLLLDLIQDKPDLRNEKNAPLDVSLVVRESTGPVPNH
ncbi:LacI family transcriptional regulator [bacterium]|nr:LacI family transcriptional regulator [bacterium]